jgi:hypothetical protein
MLASSVPRMNAEIKRCWKGLPKPSITDDVAIKKPPQGFEPWTPALRKRCSTAELRRHKLFVNNNLTIEIGRRSASATPGRKSVGSKNVADRVNRSAVNPATALRAASHPVSRLSYRPRQAKQGLSRVSAFRPGWTHLAAEQSNGPPPQ